LQHAGGVLFARVVTHSLQLRIADIGFEVHSDAAGPRLCVPLATAKFQTRQGARDVSVHASWGDLSSSPVGRRVFDSGGLWQLFEDDGYLFRFATPVLSPHPYKIARFSRDFAQGEVVIHRDYFKPETPLYPLEYPLDELLTIQLLSQGRGVEIHACGVVDEDGGGLLFVGVSGAGKSTMGLQWSGLPGVQILSDDRIILRRVGDEIWMHGTPWHGDAALARPECAVLKRVLFLKHGAANRCTDVRPTEALARLLGCAFLPFHSSAAIEAGFTSLAEVTARVPCQELTFVPDPRVVSYLRARSD
jgi:hypothetical protein